MMLGSAGRGNFCASDPVWVQEAGRELAAAHRRYSAMVAGLPGHGRAQTLNAVESRAQALWQKMQPAVARELYPELPA